MHIQSKQGSEVLRTNYTITDDINGVPTIETDELQLKQFHDTPIQMLSPAFIDEFVLVLKDEAAVADSSLVRMTGVHRFIYEMNLSRVYEEYTQYFSIENMLSLIFADSGYSFEVKGDKTYYALMFENFGDNDKMSLIQQVCSRWEVEYHIDGTHITFGDKRGSITGEVFRYKMNVLDTKVNLDISKGATYILGKFGKKAEEDGDIDTYVEKEYLHPLAAQYGRRDAKPYSNENITQESTMTEYLKRKIEETWILSIEIDVADLKGKGKVSVGDTVWAIDERMNVEIQTRIIKLIRYYDINDRVYKTKVTLGNYNFIDSVSNANNTATDVRAELDRTNRRLEQLHARWDSDFNRERDALIQRITDEMEQQKQEVQADFDAWKLYEEQARQAIRDSVDNVVGDMDTVEQTVEDWQNTASSRFNTLETGLADKLDSADLVPFDNRLDASEDGISAVFNRLEMPRPKENLNHVLKSDVMTEYISLTPSDVYAVDSLVVGDKVVLLSFDRRASGVWERPIPQAYRVEFLLHLSNGQIVRSSSGVTAHTFGEWRRMEIGAFYLNSNTPIVGISFVQWGTDPSDYTQSEIKNVMIEVSDTVREHSPYEKHASEQIAEGDVIDRLFGQLDVNSDNLEAVFGRVGDNETDIANFQLTADGLSSSVGTLRSDMDDLEQWSLAAGSDWQQTKDGFDAYVVSNNSTVGGLQTDVSNLVLRADSFSSTIGSMRGDLDDIDAWQSDMGSRFEQTALGFEQRVWKQDIDDMQIGTTNLLKHTEFNSDNLSKLSFWNWTTPETFSINTRSGKNFALVISYTNTGNFAVRINSNPEDRFTLVPGQEYVLAVEGWFSSYARNGFSYSYILRPDGTGFSLPEPYKIEDRPLSDAPNNRRYYFRFTSTLSTDYDDLQLLLGTHNDDTELSRQKWFRFTDVMLSRGNKEVEYTTSYKDGMKFSDFILRSDGFLLGGQYVGGEHYSTAIVGDANGLKLIGDNIDIDGNVNVLGKIRAESMSAVYANISEVRTRILTANSIKTNMLQVDEAMIEEFFATTGRISKLTSKLAFINSVKAIDIAAERITGGILQSQNEGMRWDLNASILKIINGSIQLSGSDNELIYVGDNFNAGTTFAANGFIMFGVGQKRTSGVKQLMITQNSRHSRFFANFASNTAGIAARKIILSPLTPENHAPEIEITTQNGTETLMTGNRFHIISEDLETHVVQARGSGGLDLIGANSNYGLRVTNAGVYIRRGSSGSWTPL